MSQSPKIMTDNHSVVKEKDRDKFIEKAEIYCSELNAKRSSAKVGNAAARAAAKIVARYVKTGNVMEFLSPMLSHELASVRFTSAACMLNHGKRRESIAILREFASEPYGLAAPMAAAVLRVHNIPLTASDSVSESE